MITISLTNTQARKTLECLHAPAMTDPVLLSVFQHILMRLAHGNKPSRRKKGVKA